MTELAVNMADLDEPSAEDIDAARVAARQLSRVSPMGKMVRFCVEHKNEAEQSDPISVPLNVFRSMIKLLIEAGNGNAVQIVPVQAELTTQQAADLLNVSRPHLVKLLATNELAHRMVGTHRKLLAKDVLAYRDRCAVGRRDALSRMVAFDEEMGLYDDEPIRPRES